MADPIVRYCANNCGTAVGPGFVRCPRCRRTMYADRGHR